MEFKPRLAKIVISTIIPLFLITLVLIIGPSIANPPKFLIAFLNIHNIINPLSSGNLTLFVIEFLVIYIIYSLFQKKNQF